MSCVMSVQPVLVILCDGTTEVCAYLMLVKCVDVTAQSRGVVELLWGDRCVCVW